MSGCPLIIFFYIFEKVFKMSSKLSITEEFINLSDDRKEEIRSTLEKKLRDYVLEKYDIYYNIFVKLSYGEYKVDDTDLTIIITRGDHFIQLGGICEDIRSLCSTLLSNIRYTVDIFSTWEYYILNFKNSIFKTTDFSKNFFDINDLHITKNDKCPIPEADPRTFILEGPILYLNLGYIDYSGYLYNPLTLLSNRKLFPLLYVSIYRFADVHPIYNKIEKHETEVYRDNRHALTYINDLTKYVNKLHVNAIYYSLERLPTQMLFFFNYLFHTIHDNLNEKVKPGHWAANIFEFKINIPHNNEIDFSYVNYTNRHFADSKRVNISLSFDAESHEISVKLKVQKSVRTYLFSMTDNLFAYDYHKEKLLKMIENLLQSNDADESFTDKEDMSESK